MPLPVICPICSQQVDPLVINNHIDAGCPSSSASSSPDTKAAKNSSSQPNRPNIAPIFNIKSSKGPGADLPTSQSMSNVNRTADHESGLEGSLRSKRAGQNSPEIAGVKRAADDHESGEGTSRRKRARQNLQEVAPLAEILRPKTLSDFFGHENIVNFLIKGLPGSLILWGPSGCGKTTLARLIAAQANAVFKELSATVAGINEVKAVVDAAKSALSLTGRRTILFLDEIHRFNKAQQDIFLPFLERGCIQLIGATTENPSFKLVGALLSRCRVFSLERLKDSDIRDIINSALIRVSSSGISQPSPLTLSEKIIMSIVSLSAGDARIAISLLELVIKVPDDLEEEKLLALLRRSVATSYDPAEDHYNMISALHKSVRGSQPDAALYWLARMLAGGEDPTFICRRMIVAASEDIGLADNHALPLAVATLHACQNIGMPECRINLAHLVSYLSEATKSTRSYEAYKRAEEAVAKDPSLPVPLTMRNAPTTLMTEVGYGKGYRYNPEFAHPVYNKYLPSDLDGAIFLEKAGRTTGRWDEEALIEWEKHSNGGERWEGRELASGTTGIQ